MKLTYYHYIVIYYIIQVLTGVEGNTNYISPRGTKYCLTRRGLIQSMLPENTFTIVLLYKETNQIQERN